MTEKPKTVEWMCTRCGQRFAKSVYNGRPLPGICPRSKFGAPHRWVKNRTW